MVKKWLSVVVLLETVVLDSISSVDFGGCPVRNQGLASSRAKDFSLETSESVLAQ